ncbi:hypothetical protein SmJEL517_g05314 [Synchytrium microbalum]|uniref:Cation-transporting P-type ATPase N-terminal domain-containing protein n=1 Tax=Synchytrium microbalum TaxID=1806994 RepID=A0A507BV10_9FUNG|nr:uncharacterized protein SmJEL517_g05314 [Synchytrium microbalum]TPX31362.1 hypothetical protein SmJEL517_g05314 [Synchytrium microbalum]
MSNEPRNVQFAGAPPPDSVAHSQQGSANPISTKNEKAMSEKKAAAKKLDIEEHMLTFDQLKERHHTSFDPIKPTISQGLTSEVAAQRLEQYGPNVLTPPKKTHWFIKFMEHLLSLFNALLIVSGILTYVLYGIVPEGNSANLYIGAILIAVAFLNAMIEFYQLQKSAALLESFMNMIPAKANVIRNGSQSQIAGADLVLGDVVFVRLGDKVPADIYVFNAGDFKVDNSSLTGESEPQDRVAHNTHTNPLEATNLAFNGTLAVAGEAYGVVVRTGDNTVLGQIAGLTSGETKRKSPLSMEIDRFVYIIGGVAITCAIVFFIVAYIKSQQIAFALNFAIGVLVAWVPQGLPATVTMLLTIAAKRMASEQVLVKDLQGVETLGAITLLATDKTGTLTRNQMTATNIWTSLKLMTTAGANENIPSGEVAVDMSVSGVSEILHISAMCSRARFEKVEGPIADRKISGDATESGLFRYAAAKLPDIDQLGDKYPKIFEIPFNSDTKWHMTIHNKPHTNGPLTQSMKGAPERILRVCDTILVDGVAVPMTDEHRAAFNFSYEYMAGKGHRVLAFAQLLLPESEFPLGFKFSKEDKNFKTTGLCFVGLASLEDPPKHGVREAIGHCREAGIKVMMVTGDHPLTAEAIGRKINLMLGETKDSLAKRTGRRVDDIKESEVSSIVIHGEKIDDLTEEDWNIIFSKDEIIFARTSPKHKLQIVKHAQSLGHIVGVTGDGVNDSPALKKADLGIAMNISGSDVSKEAAAMILLDDNFASTVNGIAEGRLIFANLKKSIRYVVTHIIPEVLPYLLYVIIPIPVAIGALQILVVDLGFELFAALSYAWELPETAGGLMRLPPRKPVTADSIKRKRAREAEQASHALVIPQDVEGGEEIKPSSFQVAFHTMKQMTQRWWWKQLFEGPEGDVLVDLDGLSYSYLEGGMIEFLGALTTFFVVFWKGVDPATGIVFGVSPWDTVQMQTNGNYFVVGAPSYTTVTGNVLNDSAQVEAFAQAQSAFYFSIMIIQMWNLFACKSRFRLPFGMYMIANTATWWSVVGGVAFTVVIVYAPPFNIAFGTSWHLLPLYWLIPMAFGAFLIFYNAARLLLKQWLTPVKWNPEISGLQMYPTRWSTGR